ncbi:helix-turn-helix domain-containing protein [Mangrovimicrobium sediminis]|uniref:Helix-turn-helix domain-containing protein n=1 Tax=Mangrovimicrobium sediminis TaxID=2562682 RepID=A0A4Z0M6K6_9GAMM|nr:helix-turn-helix domain-containing protein [Haliea sp. SAOS-164]TGD75151.1 helix-turn-helix domain-containing protein [Haliea sp. SAOS-164]
MHRVAALLYPQALATSITLPLEILQAAAQSARTRSRHSPGVSSVLAADQPGPVRLFSGITLEATHRVEDLAGIDLLIVPAIWRNPQSVVTSTCAWQPALQSLAAGETLVCAVGTGATLLAASGLLDGRPATTHWNYLDEFAARYPQVQLKTRHLITQSDNLYCVGSVNSIADLMVHIVEQWYGHGIARAVENQFSPEIRRPFRAAAYQKDEDPSHHDELVVEAQQWLRDNLGRAISIGELAERFGVSSRTLNRRFRQATGHSPQQWLQRLRVSEARDLLRRSNLPISDIAWQLGFQDVSHFGKLFRAQAGITPGRYREAVRGKLFGPEPAPLAAGSA